LLNGIRKNKQTAYGLALSNSSSHSGQVTRGLVMT